MVFRIEHARLGEALSEGTVSTGVLPIAQTVLDQEGLDRMEHRVVAAVNGGPPPIGHYAFYDELHSELRLGPLRTRSGFLR